MRSSSAARTEELAVELATTLVAGDVVLVRGAMGAGKTTFVRGACRALGVTGPVTSPTFAIGHRYASPVAPVAHVDLHRLSSLENEDPALLSDYLEPGAIAFVEWPEVAGGELTGRATVEVRLCHAGGDERDVEVERR